MDAFEISFLCVLGVVVFSLIVAFASFANIRLFCFLFLHKEWKLWRKYIKDYKSFYFDKKVSDAYLYIQRDSDIHAWVWSDGSCSIHDDNQCILCTFDKYHSKKMAKLLTDTIY